MLVHSDIQAKKTVADLQAWFQTHQRDLPWRKNYDPYEIWISEIMLQQTQVETVIPYFLRWKENLRGIKEVASASQRELLKLWEGLGYYRRVKNIKATAEILVERYQSRLPENHGELLKLPGIGEYTAGAILSIAYEAPFSVLDGNVARVFSRYFGWSLEIRTKESRDFFNRMSMKMLKYARPRDFNQGLMELGALVCLPANPKCVVCPLVSRCHSHNKDLTRCLPVINKKKTIKLEQLFII
ncbi:MAG: A/G-specific adenine glycosylase, partial [Deltaproteobacteria bacterium]|nr:A/G-specific adenine glycosylase [Deltaproteobacteria bacterium]